MALSNDEIRDVIINYLDNELKEISDGKAVEFVRGEITAMTFMLEMFNLPKLADIVERKYISQLYIIIKEGIERYYEH